jgi:hypothetical protein
LKICIGLGKDEMSNARIIIQQFCKAIEPIEKRELGLKII